MTTFNNTANRAWLVLLAGTGITWWLGESGMAASASVPAVFVMLGLAYIKGLLVIHDFMELRHAPMLWKLLLIGWLTFVLGMIALAYWTGLRLTMDTKTQHTVHELPFYDATGNEIEIFEYAWKNHLPLLIKGPTGCGKTRFVSFMAAKLGLPLYTVACHDDLTAADLVGRHLIGDGATYWSDGPLTRAVREGGICYLDEVVEARKDTTVVLHPLADDRRVLPIDRTGELIEAPSSFMLIVSYNPGYQNLMKGLKPSTRQRFVSLRFDFPSAAREEAILIGETGVDADTAKRLVAIGKSLRALKDRDLEEVASTRLLVYAATLIKAGLKPVEACRVTLVESLTDDIETTEALLEIVKATFGH